METSVVKIPPRIFRSCESGRTAAHDDDDDDDDDDDYDDDIDDDDDDDDDDIDSVAKVAPQGNCKKEKRVCYVLSMSEGTFL